MEVQNQVARSLRADLVRLHEVLNSAPSQGVTSLGRLADHVCDAFDLRDGRDRLQRALSGLSADVDLKIVGKSGELASSINAGDSDEWLEEELPPGKYVLGVYSVDADSDYLLEASADPEWTGPGASDDGSNREW